MNLVEHLPEFRVLAAATEAFLLKWSPPNRMEEFGKDLADLNQAAMNLLEAAEKAVA